MTNKHCLAGQPHTLRLVLTGVTALLLTACGAVERAASAPAPLAATPAGAITHATVNMADERHCPPFVVFDGSTFETVGLGDPSVIDPQTGKMSLAFFRFCGGKYEVLYLDRPSGASHPPLPRLR